MKYLLANRTTRFSIEVQRVCKEVNLNYYIKDIIDQLIRSAFSIGANYAEANGASSKCDFCNKIHICKKESLETKYWLALLKATQGDAHQEIELLEKEAHELTLIFSEIAKSSKT